MSVKIDQAFINTFIDGDFGLSIAHENLDFEPTSGAEYVELINIPNDITPLSLAETNQTDGLFRIILRWPVSQGAIQAKLKADLIMAAFTIGSQVSYDSQSATITRVARAKGMADDGWYKTIITISYKAFLTR